MTTIKNYNIIVCNPVEDSIKYFKSYYLEQPNYAGTCRGYFRNGNFENTWLDTKDDKYDTIKGDIRILMETLLADGFLRSESKLLQYCHDHPEAHLQDERPFFGFVCETDICSYLIMLNTTPKDYCIYVQCFLK